MCPCSQGTGIPVISELYTRAHTCLIAIGVSVSETMRLMDGGPDLVWRVKEGFLEEEGRP